jgi:hypothetical protein
MLEKTLCERIMTVYLTIVTKLLELLCIDVEESLDRIIAANSNDQGAIILLNAICQLMDGGKLEFHNCAFPAARFADEYGKRSDVLNFHVLDGTKIAYDNRLLHKTKIKTLR